MCLSPKRYRYYWCSTGTTDPKSNRWKKVNADLGESVHYRYYRWGTGTTGPPVLPVGDRYNRVCKKG